MFRSMSILSASPHYPVVKMFVIFRVVDDESSNVIYSAWVHVIEPSLI